MRMAGAKLNYESTIFIPPSGTFFETGKTRK